MQEWYSHVQIKHLRGTITRLGHAWCVAKFTSNRKGFD